jgi:dTMP kinase
MGALRLKPRAYAGKLITFCGLDGCGKTTLITMLNEYLQTRGITPILTKQPTDAVRQSQIFRTYMDCENHDGYEYLSLSLLAASDRVQHSNQVIAPLLAQGKTVLSDRYFYSCLANLHARGYQNAQWITEISAHIPKPDLAFFCDVDVDTAVARVRARTAERDRYIDLELQHALRAEYLAIAKLNGGIVIRTHVTAQESFDKIQQSVDNILGWEAT